MDSHSVIHADAQLLDSFLAAEKPASLGPKQGSVSATDPFDLFPGQIASWFTTKDCTFYQAKEEPISPIYQDSDSEETISSSESQRHSSLGNSFGSIARDASFIELYTEVMDALALPKSCETVCDIRREDAVLGLVRTYLCEICSGTDRIELKAQKQLGLGSVYKITSRDLGQLATLKQVAPGVYDIRTSDAHVRISFHAKQLSGQLHRLAEVHMPLCHLTPREPQWHAPSQCHLLDYTSPHVLASAHNFQLTHGSKVVFQLGKVGSKRFELRFQRPVDAVLGFALAVCSLVQANH